VTIRRLKNNEPVSEKDIQALEEMLFVEEQVPRDEYVALFGDKPVGLLVRSVVGLNRNAAKQAFAEFLDTAPLHPDQISFLNEVVEYLVKNGTMEPKAMFDSPFTHHNDKGVVGIMGDELAGKVVDLVRRINKNAEVA
jgi:type I restriction enzyme, R subunit